MRAYRTLPPGFTLLEIVIAVAILTVLAGLVIPTVKSLLDRAKVNRILRVCDSLRDACTRYWHDNDSFALEPPAGFNGGAALAPLLFQLTAPQASASWRGPYLSAPLQNSDNPFGGAVWLYPNLDGTPYSGFDLVGNGIRKTGAGNFALFTDIPESIARLVDAELDRGLDPADWHQTGRVMYFWTAPPFEFHQLYVFLAADTN